MRKWLWFLRDNKGLIRICRSPEGGEGGGGEGGESGDESVGVKIDMQYGSIGEKHVPIDINMAEALPPEHRDKEYFKDITFEKMTNEFVNLQTKLGERPTVGAPDVNSSQEQRDAFYNSLRPKGMDEYTFPETDFAKANAGDENFKKTSEDFQTNMRSVFHEAGISQHQADKLTVGYDKLLETAEAKIVADDENFDQKITDTFGKDGREAALTQSKNLMRDNIPEDMKPLLNNLSNDALLLLTTTLQSVHKKYISEDKIGPGSPGAVGDTKALRAEAMTIYQSKEYRDFRNPGHDSAVEKYKSLYGQIGAIQKAEATTKR